jgi:putative inorganic carbon (HCO3(-)) transporter
MSGKENVTEKSFIKGARCFAVSLPALLVIAIGVTAGCAVLFIANPLKALALAGGLALGAVIIDKTRWGVLLLIFTSYTYFSEVATEFHGAPSIILILIALLICGLVFQFFYYGEQVTGWQEVTILLVVNGLVGAATLFVTISPEVTLTALSNYGKNAIIAIIIVMLLNDEMQLRRALWALLAAVIFIGTIAVFQHISGNFGSNFGGFGQAMVKDIVGKSKGYRIGGPLGECNFFAQILLVPIPLAVHFLLHERPLHMRLMAAWALAASLLASLFTYSRGGFVALMAMVGLYSVMNPRHLKYIIVFVILVAGTFFIAAPQYFERMKSLQHTISGITQNGSNDTAFQGRLSEMIVAWKLFEDHPMLGAGLATYPKHYQTYARQVFLDFRLEERNAHSRYLEILAETGLLGMAVFSLILWRLFRGLWLSRQKALFTEKKELMEIITAFGIGLVGFLTASIFLHDGYPRYFWILASIGFAIPNVVKLECQDR